MHRPNTTSQYLPVTKISNGTDQWGNNAFGGTFDSDWNPIPNTTLEAVHIPATVTEIGECAFSYCTSLTSITIPASVTTMGGWVFEGWTTSQTINVPFANANSKPAGWHDEWNVTGWDNDWNSISNAVIKYWNGSTWE